jgi:hypothetical protein
VDNTQTQTPAVVAPDPTSAVPATTTGSLLGDKLPTLKDIILPRVNLVQNIGTLSEDHDSGSLLFDSNTVIFSAPVIRGGQIATPASAPVIMTALGFRPTRYVEKIPNSAVRGMIVDTEEQVRANNGTLDYAEWKLKEKQGMKRFEELADALVAIRKPENIDDNGAIFSYDVEGQLYALGLWALKGTVYTATCKKVWFAHRRIGCLRVGGYPSWNYAVSTAEKQFGGGNRSWVPVVLPREKNTEAFLDFARSILCE